MPPPELQVEPNCRRFEQRREAASRRRCACCQDEERGTPHRIAGQGLPVTTHDARSQFARTGQVAGRLTAALI
eukprot:2545659-Prymnesium_polylepis.2